MSNDWIDIPERPKAEVARERAKARDLDFHSERPVARNVVLF